MTKECESYVVENKVTFFPDTVYNTPILLLDLTYGRTVALCPNVT